MGHTVKTKALYLLNFPEKHKNLLGSPGSFFPRKQLFLPSPVNTQLPRLAVPERVQALVSAVRGRRMGVTRTAFFPISASDYVILRQLSGCIPSVSPNAIQPHPQPRFVISDGYELQRQSPNRGRVASFQPACRCGAGSARVISGGFLKAV